MNETNSYIKLGHKDVVKIRNKVCTTINYVRDSNRNKLIEDYEKQLEEYNNSGIISKLIKGKPIHPADGPKDKYGLTPMELINVQYSKWEKTIILLASSKKEAYIGADDWESISAFMY